MNNCLLNYLCMLLTDKRVNHSLPVASFTRDQNLKTTFYLVYLVEIFFSSFQNFSNIQYLSKQYLLINVIYCHVLHLPFQFIAIFKIHLSFIFTVARILRISCYLYFTISLNFHLKANLNPFF